MGILVKKHMGVPHLTGIAKLAVIALLVSFAASLVDTIWAVYLDSFLHSEVYVGLFSSLLTIIAFVSFFVFIPLIERGNKPKIYTMALLIFIVCYLIFFFNSNFYVFVVVAILITVAITFRITSFGILVRDISENRGLSRNEGVVYTFNNIAWVIGPLLAGYLAAQFGEKHIFIFSAVFIAAALIFFRFARIKDDNVKKKVDKHLLKNFVEFFGSKERTTAYFLGGGIYIWWTLIYLFMPLQIIRAGLDDLWIGYFLFAVAVPLIIFEYAFSKLAGRQGFRKMFQISYFGLTAISVVCFFVGSIYVTMALLILGGVCLSMLEPTTEAYFFDILKGKEKYRFYGPYNTAIDAGGLIGRLPVAILLIFLPFKFVFLMVGLFMFLLFLLSFRVKKIVEEKRR